MEKAAPGEVVIVTDQQISVPSSWIVKRPVSSIRMWDWFNEAVEHCTSEWIIVPGIDDIYFPNAFTDISLIGDVVFICLVHNGIAGHFPSLDEWRDRVLRLDSNPGWMPIICRRDAFLKYPWRRIIYPDWLQIIEFRYHELIISIDPTPRFTHRVHRSNHSGISWHQSIGFSQVRFVQKVMQSEPVMPGPEWPPQGLVFGSAPVISPSLTRIMDMRQKRKKR